MWKGKLKVLIIMNKVLKWIASLLFICFPGSVYSSAENVLILFSGEEVGNIEPCGCFEGQIGGISRRYTLIDSLKSRGNIILPLSFGDLVKNSGRQDEVKLEYQYRALQKMGYILHNLGEKDLEISPGLINYLSHISEVAFLASNMKFTAPFPVEIKPYILKEFNDNKNSFKIAFIGVLSSALVDDSVKSYINISDPVKSLRPLVKMLQEEAGLIVLLFHGQMEESLKIAKMFPEIGLIITGHDIDDPVDMVAYVNNTPIVSSGRGGKYLGLVRYSIGKNTLERKSIEIIPLDNKYKDSREMHLLLQEYQQTLKEEDLLDKVSQASLHEGLTYVGSYACRICHKTVYDHWSKTSHGMSYNTLVKSGQQYDPECVRCHTTGHGYISGFVNYEKHRNLTDVGCESCHRAGSDHIKNVNVAYGSTDEYDCRLCHDSEHSPLFQFKEYWAKIAHPKETPMQ